MGVCFSNDQFQMSGQYWTLQLQKEIEIIVEDGVDGVFACLELFRLYVSNLRLEICIDIEKYY